MKTKTVCDIYLDLVHLAPLMIGFGLLYALLLTYLIIKEQRRKEMYYNDGPFDPYADLTNLNNLEPYSYEILDISDMTPDEQVAHFDTREEFNGER